MTIILDTAALRAIVADVGVDQLMDEMIERLRDRFEAFDPKTTESIQRTGFAYQQPSLGLIEWMPTMQCGERVSIKTVGYHPANPTLRSLPSVLATTSLYDTTTGELLALTDSTFLTALRTGAASAIATDLLAPRDVETVGIIGCGAQAVTQLHAISRVRPFTRVLAYDADPSVAATLLERLPSSVGHRVTVDVVAAEDRAALLGSVDVLCTVTSVDPGEDAVIADGDHKRSLHVNAVGADFPGKLELPDSLIDRAAVVPDVVEQCLVEGESQRLTEDELAADLATLCAEPTTAQALQQRLTVFDSTGWALEDMVAAELALEHAARLDVGVDAELQLIGDDPYDPYRAVGG